MYVGYYILIHSMSVMIPEVIGTKNGCRNRTVFAGKQLFNLLLCGWLRNFFGYYYLRQDLDDLLLSLV